MLGVLDAGADEDAGGRQELLGVEGIVVALGLDEGGQQIVDGAAPALFDQSADVLAKAPRAFVGVGELCIGDRRVDRGDEAIGPGDEVRMAVARGAQHLADHGDGDVVREVLHQLAAPLLGERVEQVVDPALEEAAHAFDGPGREGAGDQLAQPRVVRRVHEGKHVAEGLEGRAVRITRVAADAGLPAAALAEGRVAEDGLGRGVGRRVPEAVLGAEDRGLRAERREEGDRVVGKRGLGQGADEGIGLHREGTSGCAATALCGSFTNAISALASRTRARKTWKARV